MLSTIGSIANHINESFVLPIGVSGNLIETVNLNLLDVSNYTGANIGSNSIDSKYQTAITNFSKAQALSEAFAWASTVSTSGGAVIIDDTDEAMKLGELTIDSATGKQTAALNYLSSLSKDTPNQFRQLAMTNLKNIGRKINFARSLS